MSAEDEKSKKLKEIQDRLAEIQGKLGNSNEPANKPATSNPEPKPATGSNPSAPPTKNSADKNEIDEPKTDPPASKPSVQKADTPKSKNEPHPLIKATTPNPLEKAKSESKSSTPDSAGWSQNKVTAAPEEVKKGAAINKPAAQKKDPKKQPSKNRANKILSFISLAITLSVAAYIVYAYVLYPNGAQQEVVEADIPHTPEDIAQPIETEKETTQNTDEDKASPTDPVETKEAPVQHAAQRVNEKRTERKESIVDKKLSEPIAHAAIEKSAVPGGFIISYASNGNSDAAAKNVRFLRSKGFSANYYFMKDKDANAPSLYKVYLGPYSSESEAFPDFKKIIKLNEKAFILNMN